MGRTVFDGFGRWRIVDNGDVVARSPQVDRQTRQRGLVPDCHSVWGVGASLGQQEHVEHAPTAVAPTRPAVAAQPSPTAPVTPNPQVVTLRQAAAAGMPFCEVCERAKAEAAQSESNQGKSNP